MAKDLKAVTLSNQNEEMNSKKTRGRGTWMKYQVGS